MHAKINAFSLVEVLLALAVLGLLVVGVGFTASTTVEGLALTDAQTRTLLAANGCMESLIWLRNAAGFDALTAGTWGITADTIPELVKQPQTSNGVRISVAIGDSGADEKEVRCEAFWDTTPGSHSFALESLLAR